MSMPQSLTDGEPHRGVIGVPLPADWSGLDFLQRYVRREVDGGPVGRLTGIRASEFGAGRSTCVLPLTPWLQNSATFIEPGAVVLLADAPLSMAIMSGLGPGKGVVTSELSMTYVQPVTRGTSSLVARAATAWHCTLGGTVYGGALAWFAQSCMEVAILTTLPAGTLYGTLDLTVHFIRPVVPGEGTVKVEATVDHRGRLVRVASARILDAEGRTAALARASAMVVPDGIRRMLRGEFLRPGMIED